MFLSSSTMHILEQAGIAARRNLAERLTPDDITTLLRRVGALREVGHYVYSNEEHGSMYVDTNHLFLYPEIAALLCERLAIELDGFDIEAIVGPSQRDTILAYETGKRLARIRGKDVPGIWAEPKGRRYIFPATFTKILHGARVAIVQDVVTTGISAILSGQSVRDAGGEPVALGTLWKRGSATAQEVGVSGIVPLFVSAAESAPCILCTNRIPVNEELGHGEEYMKRVRGEFLE